MDNNKWLYEVDSAYAKMIADAEARSDSLNAAIYAAYREGIRNLIAKDQAPKTPIDEPKKIGFFGRLFGRG